MNFWFYLPNLVVVEIVLAQYAALQRPWLQLTSSATLLIANVFILFASFFFVRDYWGPGIMGAFDIF